jgi:O-antigen ligase
MQHPSLKYNIFSPFWLVAWSMVSAISWLLPNHYRPWLAFHLDAWTSICLLIAGYAVFWCAAKPMILHRIALFAALWMLIPLLQFSFGLIHVAGVAWISSAYIAGFYLALLLGAQWETNAPKQPVNGLFLAIGVASVISVGLQLQQWLQIEGLELWKMGGGAERPYANFGQPNQLGTLLLWGLLATAWGWLRGQVNARLAIVMAAFVLFGLALTGSRTAWFGTSLVVVAGWLWRRLWPNARTPWVVTSLALYFVVCVVIQADLRSLLIGDAALPSEYLNPMSGQQRLIAWSAFADALLQRPWFGYGWSQVVSAQLAVATEHPTLNGVFTSTHNLFLDLLIWCGIPLGLLIALALVAWLWRKLKAIRSAEDVILVMFLVVVANHAMLELPLHYAYFLLPVGLVMGVLNSRMGEVTVFVLPRWLSAGIWMGATLLLVLIIRDYSRIEPSHENFRMQQMRIKVAHIDAPDVLMLTQWREFIEVGRTEPTANMSASDIDRIRTVVNLFGGALFIHKLATALALNQQAGEAQLWLRRLCKSAPLQDCIDAQAVWNNQSLKYPDIAAIPWSN